MDFKDFDSHYIMSDAGTFIGYMHDNFEETNDDGIWSYISDKFGIIHQQGKLSKINLTKGDDVKCADSKNAFISS